MVSKPTAIANMKIKLIDGLHDPLRSGVGAGEALPMTDGSERDCVISSAGTSRCVIEQAEGRRGPVCGVERLLVPAHHPRADGDFRSQI